MAGGNSLDTSAANIDDQIAKLAIDLKWTDNQRNLFTKATAILLELRHQEVVVRGAEVQLHGLNVTGFDPLSAYVASSTSKLRELLAEILWDKTQVLWLLKAIYDHHDEPHRQLCSRLLQRLHYKVPELVKSTGLLEAQEFSSELRSWIASDPLKMNWSTAETKPNDALLVCLPCEWSWSSPLLKSWADLLAKKWALTTFTSKLDSSNIEALDKGSEALLQRVVQSHPGRPLGLVTFGEGAKTGVNMARKYASVQFLINLAPSIGIKPGSSSLTVDSYKSMRVPSAIVLGQDTTTCDLAQLEESMRKFHSTSRVIAMPHGNHHLLLDRQLKDEEHKSQRMANMLIIQQIVAFIQEHTVKYALSNVRQAYLQTPRTLATPVGTALYQGTNPMSAYGYGSTLQGNPISFMQRSASGSPVTLASHFNAMASTSQVQYASSYQGTGYSAYTVKPGSLMTASQEAVTSSSGAKRDGTQASTTSTTTTTTAKLSKPE
eukprot:m.26651 g.26651  ORF g.26651 m.26651 type:complete len:491 (-) comp11695_c0_seq1:114-1586(-)